MLNFRFVDENKYRVEKERRTIDILGKNEYVDKKCLTERLNSLYRLGLPRKRYTHSTYHMEKKPVYRDEEYTVFERQYITENGRSHYENVPITKTKTVFSHYDERVVEDRHYEIATIKGEVLNIIRLKSDLFSKLVNMIAKSRLKKVSKNNVKNVINNITDNTDNIDNVNNIDHKNKKENKKIKNLLELTKLT